MCLHEAEQISERWTCVWVSTANCEPRNQRGQDSPLWLNFRQHVPEYQKRPMRTGQRNERQAFSPGIRTTRLTREQRQQRRSSEALEKTKRQLDPSITPRPTPLTSPTSLLTSSI
ncbi:hypothetical protein DPEC_G00121760 [Dallia pectoralis]|uniref:Uncharacterized protein n=1 Tax=Dallia pectoralis TaxID=75939 RepID=A0ACC2GQI4_DALPE|nr:hypothetical protein DPEC_G00121760 [Dallia pectoralis]